MQEGDENAVSRVLSALRAAHNMLSVDQIAEQTGIDEQAVEAHLITLEAVSQSPHGDEDAGDVNEGTVHQRVALVPHDEPAEAVEPREEPLDDPASLVAPHAPAIVRPGLRSAVRAMRSEQLDVDARERGAEFVGVVRLVRDDALRPARGIITCELRYFFDGRLRERRFAFVRSGELNSDRKTLADDQNSKLRSLSPLGEADCVAPFFALTKVASRNVSSHSRRPFSSRAPSTARQTSFQTSRSSHIRSRRQHVAYPGNSLGNAFHCAPVFRIQRMPSRHSRSLRHGRPRPSLRRGSAGKCGSIRAHCSSVIRIMDS